MKVLFFVEPAIFGFDPKISVSHLRWPLALGPAICAAEGSVAIAGNEEVCVAWREAMMARDQPAITFPIDSFEVLREHGFVLNRYCAAQALTEPGAATLYSSLSAIRDSFRPDIVFHSSQQSTLRKVFFNVPVIGIEQGVLMRGGHLERVCFDPGGHLVGSIIETERDRIVDWPLSAPERDSLIALRNELTAHAVSFPTQAGAAAELRRIAEGRKVALMAMQTPGGWPCHDNYDASDPVSLVCRWADELPAGWIGVPTYHFGFQFSPSMEAALARHGRLQFLSRQHSIDATEALLTEADALITVSSTTAMTALLFGKKAVTVGKAPMHNWGCKRVEDLNDGPTLPIRQVSSTLAFLTNRFSWPLARIAQPDAIAGLTRGFIAEGKEWSFDRTDFDMSRARSCFSLAA